MLHTILFCILWAKPQVEIVQIPVNEYSMADLRTQFGEFYFEASVLEEDLNYVKITHIPSQFSSEANASRDHQQKSFYIKLDLKDNQASLDCEINEMVSQN
jgi:hypothetical protein